MLKENWRLISRLERLGDTLIIVGAFFFAYYGRQSLLFWDGYLGLGLPFTGSELAPLKDYFIVLFAGLAAYLSLLQLLGAYSSMRFSSHWRLMRIAFLSSFLVFFILAATLFLLKIDLSRSFITLFCVLVGLSLAAERFIVLRFLRLWRRRGRNFRNVIVCGTGEQAVQLAVKIAARNELGIRIRAFADLRSPPLDAKCEQLQRFREAAQAASGGRSARVIQGVAALAKTLEAHAIDEVIFTDVVEVMPAVEEMVIICSEQGVRATIAADLFSVGIVKSGISYFEDMPLIHFQTPPGDRWELAVKRTVDIVVSALLLMLFAPLFLLIALLVALGSPGPVLFSQKRIGLNGRIFTLYKFRSMYVHASRGLDKLRAQNEMNGPVFKMRRDPRVTPVGRILRRFSLDELPQLWNVMIGDMSLVGPRPPVPGEVNCYERKTRRRLSMRPGLTCTWQVSGRNEIKDFDSWVELDLEYIDNWSLMRDFVLLFRTIPAVLFGTGAS